MQESGKPGRWSHATVPIRINIQYIRSTMQAYHSSSHSGLSWFDPRWAPTRERGRRRIRTRRLHALLPCLECCPTVMSRSPSLGIARRRRRRRHPFRALDARSAQEPALLLVCAHCMRWWVLACSSALSLAGLSLPHAGTFGDLGEMIMSWRSCHVMFLSCPARWGFCKWLDMPILAV